MIRYPIKLFKYIIYFLCLLITLIYSGGFFIFAIIQDNLMKMMDKLDRWKNS